MGGEGRKGWQMAVAEGKVGRTEPGTTSPWPRPEQTMIEAMSRWGRGRSFALLGVLLLALTMASCRGGKDKEERSGPAAAPGEKPLVVAVTLAPQRYFVESLAGDRAAVEVLLPPGANHETYEPTIRTLTGLQGARLWFQVGPAIFPFETAWSAKVLAAAPGMKAVDTSTGVPLLDANPHIWLSPKRVVLQARTMARALAAQDPAGKAEYEQRLASFEQQLAALDRELASLLEPVRGRSLVIFHPSWDYFAHDYGFSFLAIEQEGHVPGAAGLERLLAEARQAGARDVFVEPHVSSRLASTVAGELGGQVVVIDPLPLDWPDGLRRAARTIVEHAR